MTFSSVSIQYKFEHEIVEHSLQIKIDEKNIIWIYAYRLPVTTVYDLITRSGKSDVIIKRDYVAIKHNNHDKPRLYLN